MLDQHYVFQIYNNIYSIQILFFMANIILYKSKFIFYWDIFNVFKNTFNNLQDFLSKNVFDFKLRN